MCKWWIYRDWLFICLIDMIRDGVFKSIITCRLNVPARWVALTTRRILSNLSLFGWDERSVRKWLARRDDRQCLGSSLPCKRRELIKVSSWSSSLSDKWWLVRVKRGSKHWLVQILNALDLILSTRLSIRILQVARLVPTNVYASL